MDGGSADQPVPVAKGKAENVMMRAAYTVQVLALIAAAVLAGCGENGGDGAAVAERPKSGIAAMTDADKAFYASSFTTLGTVPYGRCWPDGLFKILSAGHTIEPNQRLVVFNAPKRFKQNEGYPEWLRVKSVMVERDTRRVVAAKGYVGPFADDTAVQAYLDSEIRPDLNSHIVVVKDESSNANGEMRFLCASKYGGNYTLRITIRKDPSGALWLDASTAVSD